MIKFLDDRIKQEFNDQRFDNRLRIIIFALAGFVEYRFGKDIALTHIFRTQAEQDDIYKDFPTYKQAPWHSVHQYWRGADFRSYEFGELELAEIERFLNDSFSYATVGKKTCIIHDVGRGKHAHLQTDPTDRTCILRGTI